MENEKKSAMRPENMPSGGAPAGMEMPPKGFPGNGKPPKGFPGKGMPPKGAPATGGKMMPPDDMDDFDDIPADADDSRGHGGPGGPPGGPGGPGGPGMGVKAKDFKGTWIKLLKYCKTYLPFMIIAVVCSAFGTVFMIMGPDKIKDMTAIISSGIMTGIDMTALKKAAFTLVWFYALSAGLSIVQELILAETTHRISYRMRRELSHKINTLPISYYNRTTTGDILSRITNDVDTCGMSISNSFGSVVSSITQLVGTLIMMLITSVPLTLISIASALLGFVFMALIMGRSGKYFMQQQKALGIVNSQVEEIYSGHTVVKAYNGEEAAIERFRQANETLRRNGFKASCLGGLMPPIMGFVGNLGYVAVCVAGAIMTKNGTMGFEVIVAFIMYIRYFTQPLSRIGQLAQTLQQAAAAGERVFEFLDAADMPDESEKAPRTGDIKGKVEFDHVRFRYEDTDSDVIHDFSATAYPGQKIAIVGPTGAGKTTMVNLLMRFHDIDSGEIRIDGIPTRDTTREDVHALFCMVLQDTWLFEGTVRENLVYNTENVSDDKLDAACKAVGLDHFIKTLPDGYNTVLSDRVALSQGQRQQLTIARAMVADKPMLILDEATSSVDTRTELKIQAAMDKLMENRTSFVIAHRLSTIRDADLILVMRDGDIVESGTHEGLLEKGGFYAELYNSQFRNAE